jgi:hypothetical protein
VVYNCSDANLEGCHDLVSLGTSKCTLGDVTSCKRALIAICPKLEASKDYLN